MSAPIGKIETRVLALKHEIEKLEEAGLTFAASLVRVAQVDLQMRLCGIGDEDIDALSFAVRAVEQEKAARANPPVSIAKLRAARAKRGGP